MRLHALIVVAITTVVGSDIQARFSTRDVEVALAEIRPERLRAHIRFLSDDLLDGRGTGTRGHEIAARYVAAEFEAIGLEAPLGRYLHPVKIRAAQVDAGRTTLELHRRDGAITQFRHGVDFLVAPDLLQEESTLEAAVFFAGYCVSAPEFRYDDFKNVDLKGKLVGCLRGSPPSFPTPAQARFSSFDPKYEALAARGAAGMVDLRPQKSEATFPWAAMVRGFGGTWMDWLDENGQPARNKGAIRGAIVPSAGSVAELFAQAPATFLEAIAETDRGTLHPIDLGVRLRLQRTMRHTQLKSPNVIGLLAGSDPILRDEYVVYTAHLDHLGVGTPVNGDSIYNGASDNASGTAALIEIARSFASMPRRPRRSILFVAVTGEEAGVVGSDYFVHNPPVPLKQIVANVNIDGIAALHPALSDVVAIGGGDSALLDAARTAAERLGLELSPDPAPERLYYLLGDQYSFIKAGIPAVWTIAGDKSRDPAIDAAAFRRRWGSTIYHTPADDMAQDWNWTSATTFTRMQFLIGYNVANHLSPSSNEP